MKRTLLESAFLKYLEELDSLFCVFDYIRLQESYSVEDYKRHIENLLKKITKATNKINVYLKNNIDVKNELKKLSIRETKELVETIDGLLFNIIHYYRKMVRLIMLNLNYSCPKLEKRHLTKLLYADADYQSVTVSLNETFKYLENIVSSNEDIFFTHCFKHTEQMLPEDLSIGNYIKFQKKYDYLDTYVRIEPRFRSIA